MPTCPSCDQRTLDPGAQFCARCGTALPRSSARRYSPRSTPGIPVAVAFAALALGVLAAVALAGGSKGGSPRVAHTVAAAHGVRAGAPPGAVAALAVAIPAHPPPPALQPGGAGAGARTARYDGGSYSLAYPAGWSVAKNNQRIANYAETMLENRSATAKVTIDHTADEVTDPAVKAAQVEAATSRTPGYNRVAWRALTIGGRSAFEWIFTLAGARDPQRADIFVNTGHDGFAFLAHGASWRQASAAARAIAASVNVRG